MLALTPRFDFFQRLCDSRPTSACVHPPGPPYARTLALKCRRMDRKGDHAQDSHLKLPEVLLRLHLLRGISSQLNLRAALFAYTYRLQKEKENTEQSQKSRSLGQRPCIDMLWPLSTRPFLFRSCSWCRGKKGKESSAQEMGRTALF